MKQLKNSYDIETTVHLGESLLKRAEIIYERVMRDCYKLDKIFSEFYSTHQTELSKLHIKREYFNQLLGYYSKSFNGSFPGPEELKMYWLKYVLRYSMFIDKKRTEEESIIKIASDFEILKRYNTADFDGDKFNVTYPIENNRPVIFRVPHKVNKILVDLSIRIFEEFTTSKVFAISLLYSKHEFHSGDMNHEMEVSLNSKDNKDALVYRVKYDAFSFRNNAKWCMELNEFEKVFY